MEKNDHTICIGIVSKLHIIYDVLFSFSMTDYIISQSYSKKKYHFDRIKSYLRILVAVVLYRNWIRNVFLVWW